VRWLIEPKRLSREQFRMIEKAGRSNEPVALSVVSLLEIAVLTGQGKVKASLADVFGKLRLDPFFQVLPITYEIAAEVAAMGNWLRDPSDRAIVATARVHRLRLVTSDQRIIESKLVPVVE
jgi:PIN domain nuclease of toxin-antitoxin system